jgi:hypothetical protein
MEPLTGLQALTAALTLYEKATKILREWAGKLPETSDKKEAAKDLEKADEAMEIARPR